jgi:hypothetical protein
MAQMDNNLKLYFIGLSSSYDRDAVIKLFDEKKIIDDWFYYLPSSFFGYSRLQSMEILEALQANFPVDQCLIIEINKGSNWAARVPPTQVEHLRAKTQ